MKFLNLRKMVKKLNRVKRDGRRRRRRRRRGGRGRGRGRGGRSRKEDTKRRNTRKSIFEEFKGRTLRKKHQKSVQRFNEKRVLVGFEKLESEVDENRRFNELNKFVDTDEERDSEVHFRE